MTKFSDFANTLKASDIAELLELTEKPEVISFAGGAAGTRIVPNRRNEAGRSGYL